LLHSTNQRQKHRPPYHQSTAKTSTTKSWRVLSPNKSFVSAFKSPYQLGMPGCTLTPLEGWRD
jgi:hypothetical protein